MLIQRFLALRIAAARTLIALLQRRPRSGAVEARSGDVRGSTGQRAADGLTSCGDEERHGDGCVSVLKSMEICCIR